VRPARLQGELTVLGACHPALFHVDEIRSGAQDFTDPHLGAALRPVPVKAGTAVIAPVAENACPGKPHGPELRGP
jgi:hypothetical protein